MTTISLNIESLRNFISSKIPSADSITITINHNLPHVLYNRILQYIYTSKISVKFITEKTITFKNEEHFAQFILPTDKEYLLIQDILNKRLQYEHLIGSNYNGIYFKKLALVNDKIFNVTISEKSDRFTNKIFNEPIFENKQIIIINDDIKLVVSNDNNFYFEFQFDQDIDNNTFDQNIRMIINLIYDMKPIIIEDNMFIDNYRSIMNLRSTETLRTINPSTLLIEHLLDKVNFSHCVFIKTDGERVHIHIYNSHVIYINSILNCFSITNINDSKLNVVMDAEKYEDKFFVFNLLYTNTESDINNMSLLKKLEICTTLISNMNLNNIFVKTPIFPLGTKEEFFSKIVELIETKSDIKSDGIIFQSILSFNKSREKGISDYKWKPVYESSLDFFVKINSTLVKKEDGYYNKVDLYGYDYVKDDKANQIEEIKKFTDVYLPTSLKTQNGELIIDNVVIEFLPDKDELNNIIWNPYRLRYDKTMATIKYERKHGNHISVCEETLDFIRTPILESDFKILSENYDEGYSVLAQKIKNKKITTKKDPVNGKIFDFVKTNIFTTLSRYYFKINVFNQINMIDINCRNGIDLLKIYTYAVLFGKGNFTYDAFNDNRTEIESTFNGAISRYDKYRLDRAYSNFPICTFTIADMNTMLNSINKKYNNFVSFEFYRYQSKRAIYQVKDLMDKVLTRDGFAFIIIADITDNKLSNTLIQDNICDGFKVSLSLNDIIRIFKNYEFIEKDSFIYHLEKLNLNRDIIQHMSNKNTADFLVQVLNAFNKIDHAIYSRLHICVLKKN